MSIPGSNDVQLYPPGGATFTVDSMTDPNGNPANVLDVDRGFEVSGTVTLPCVMQGKATVSLYADELGGKFDGSIGSTTLTITGCGQEPISSKTYPWTVKYDGTSLPDPSSGSQLYHLAAVFVFGDQALDIGSFVDLGMFLIN
jgi:hypothetical protein